MAHPVYAMMSVSSKLVFKVPQFIRDNKKVRKLNFTAGSRASYQREFNAMMTRDFLH
jgi:hypothetical protein